MKSTRRNILVGSATMAALATSPVGKAAAPATRYNAKSAEGKVMLAKYARAVARMKDLPPTDPRNWNFQWFTHWIPGFDPRSNWEGSELLKKTVLDQTFGPRPSPERSLAEEMWNACQSHGKNPHNPNAFATTYFLPWHRWFVFFFEQIIRGVLNDDSFTLPYWDYLGPAPDARSAPPEFLDPASPLYVAIRNPWVNQGQPIDKQNPGTLNFNASRSPIYIDPTGQTGFCAVINQNPHGLVHDYTGNENDMGFVPTAAQDPIFWIHHCNIDRLWASWNTRYRNPVWDDRVFVFADGRGKRVTVNPNGATDTVRLGYGYDSLQPVLPPLVRGGGPKALQALPPSQSMSGPVQLSRKAPASVSLRRASMTDHSEHKMLGAAPGGAPGSYLHLSGVDLPVAINGTYNVFLNLPQGAAATPASPHYVGTFGSFEIMSQGAHHEEAGGSLVFEISDAQARAAASGTPRVTFVPVGSIRYAPTVESVSIVSN
jgi:tyrosinase